MTREQPAAFDPEILLAHGDFLRALARGLVADPLQADDVVQDTWLAAISKPPRAGSGVRAWLAAVARKWGHANCACSNRHRGETTPLRPAPEPRRRKGSHGYH